MGSCQKGKPCFTKDVVTGRFPMLQSMSHIQVQKGSYDKTYSYESQSLGIDKQAKPTGRAKSFPETP